MPPKIDRYPTEPKTPGTTGTRVSVKMVPKARSVIGKQLDLRRLTMRNLGDDLLYKQGVTSCNYPPGQETKKKNFIVNKKKNKAVSTFMRGFSAMDTQSRMDSKNSSISEIQFESYKGLRDYNEDRILIQQNVGGERVKGSLIAIFDGHGGSSASQFMKSNYGKSFQNFLKSFTVEESLKKSLEQMEVKILQHGHKISSGSCAVVLFIADDRRYYCANVGDSRLLYVKGREDFTQITEDHKPENPKQMLRIQQNGGRLYRNTFVDSQTRQKSYGPLRVHPSRLSVSRTIGDFSIKRNQLQPIISAQPEIYTGMVENGGVFVMMSDGGYEQFTNQQISVVFGESAGKQDSLRVRLNNFIYSCKKKATNDNVSVIAIQLAPDSKSYKTESTIYDSLTKQDVSLVHHHK